VDVIDASLGVCAEYGLASRLHTLGRGLGACTALSKLELSCTCLIVLVGCMMLASKTGLVSGAVFLFEAQVEATARAVVLLVWHVAQLCCVGFCLMHAVQWCVLVDDCVSLQGASWRQRMAMLWLEFCPIARCCRISTSAVRSVTPRDAASPSTPQCYAVHTWLLFGACRFHCKGICARPVQPPSMSHACSNTVGCW